MNHRDRVPPDDPADALFERRVPGVLFLFARRNRVHEVRRERPFGEHSAAARHLDDALDEKAGARLAARPQHGLEGVHPFARFDGIGVYGFGSERMHALISFWRFRALLATAASRRCVKAVIDG